MQLSNINMKTIIDIISRKEEKKIKQNQMQKKISYLLFVIGT